MEEDREWQGQKNMLLKQDFKVLPMANKMGEG